MKAILLIEREFDLKTLHVSAGVRHWDDIEISGGSEIPCREGNMWCPVIDVETGIITNWIEGVSASIHSKVCDAGRYIIKDDKGEAVIRREGYVIRCMCPKENGYGDYIIMDVDASGLIANWKFNPDDFSSDED